MGGEDATGERCIIELISRLFVAKALNSPVCWTGVKQRGTGFPEAAPPEACAVATTP